MANAFYASWQRSGGGYTLAYPVADLAATLRHHGYTVGTIGDSSHMLASTPEDHTPYSRTGWPIPSPYGWIFALDIMPAGSSLPSLAALGAQLVADRNAGVATAIKYLNWQPAGGSCRHESWEPGHLITPSSDVGHIHVSFRTDFQLSHSMGGYDPVARVRGAVTPVALTQPSTGLPAFPGRTLVYSGRTPLMQGTDVKQAQARLKARGWRITVDGWYGSESAGVVRSFQSDSTAHGWPLSVDGELGPHTWDALWRRPVS